MIDFQSCRQEIGLPWAKNTHTHKYLASVCSFIKVAKKIDVTWSRCMTQNVPECPAYSKFSNSITPLNISLRLSYPPILIFNIPVSES